jgi:precorrin-4/cobalt-precorrin-4 C11-methyltransferase
MTVHFIGAGPGAADLLTLRGRDRLAACRVCLYAGSLIPADMLEHVGADARCINTQSMALDAIVEQMRAAHAAGQDVARLQSGDLSVYSALGEQIRRLRALGIDYTMTPGVPAFAACAATLGQELTLPEVGQSVVLTRTQGRASSMPDSETLENFAAARTTLAIHLSLHNIADVAARLTPFYGADCPVAVILRASWPDEQTVTGTLADIVARVEALAMRRSALILVGRVLEHHDFRESALYDPAHIGRFQRSAEDSPPESAE